MSLSEQYRKVRKGLGFLAGAIAIVAFFLGVAFSSSGTEEQRANFAYNLSIVVAISWAYSSGIAKLLMIEGQKGRKWLNVIGLLLLVLFMVLGTQIPQGPSPSNTLYLINSILISLWVISWGVLDVCEIVL